MKTNLNNMKTRLIICFISLLLLFACVAKSPKDFSLKILQYAKDGNKEKILESINPNFWEGDVNRDGTELEKEETINNLVDAMRVRDVKGEENIHVLWEASDRISFKYVDPELVNGKTLLVTFVIVEIEKKYYINSIVVGHGTPYF